MTEELLATHKETELKYRLARSVCDDMGNVQRDWQPNNLALCTEGQPPGVAQEIHWHVAHHLKRAPNMPRCYSEDDSDSDEEQVAPKKRRTAIKSGKMCTADTTVLKQIVWPHKLVYDPSGRPAAYDDRPLHYSFKGILPSSKLRNRRRKI